MTDVPRVAISRCLLGDHVRFDGGHKRDSILVELAGVVEWVPVCPELEVGMGVPREPVRLTARADGVPSAGERVRLLGAASGEDWTDRMRAWSRDRLRALEDLKVSGFVLKSRSPSCGITVVPVIHAAHGDEAMTQTGRGLFAQAVAEAMPDVPAEEEERLHDRAVRELFLARVFEYHESHARHRGR